MERDNFRVRDAIKVKKELLKKIVIFTIDFYIKFISPLVPTQCRYHPTCSTYMKESIKKKGLIKGILYGIKRILKCNPLFSGGYDPVK